MSHVPFTVCIKGNENCTGIAIDTFLQTIVNSTTGTVSQIPMVAVLWDNESMRSPAPSFHAPKDLEWLTVPGIIEPEEDDEEDEEEEQPPYGYDENMGLKDAPEGEGIG